MSDEIETIVRLVGAGHLSPDEAAPIIEALTRRERTAAAPPQEAGRVSADRGRRVRIRVSEHGRRVVDVRLPLAFAAMAARMIPGLPESYSALIEQAVRAETIGPIVDAEAEDGDSVLISVE